MGSLRGQIMKDGYVYTTASPSRTIYIGVTSDPEGRIWEHKTLAVPGFTSKHHCTRFVLIEEFSDIQDAFAREKELKGWRRSRKIELIEAENPDWADLARHWYD
jgi:putative endonuclease